MARLRRGRSIYALLMLAAALLSPDASLAWDNGAARTPTRGWQNCAILPKL
jgi:hypothetical protein